MKNKLAYAMLAAFTLSIIVCSGAAALQKIVDGTLVKTAGGGETTGWSVRLDEPYVMAGKVYDSIEVYPGKDDISSLEGKHVTVSGTFVEWRTKERGKFIVLEICDISETGK